MCYQDIKNEERCQYFFILNVYVFFPLRETGAESQQTADCGRNFLLDKGKDR